MRLPLLALINPLAKTKKKTRTRQKYMEEGLNVQYVLFTWTTSWVTGTVGHWTCLAARLMIMCQGTSFKENDLHTWECIGTGAVRRFPGPPGILR